MKKFSYCCYSCSLTSVQDVISQMEQLDEELKGTDMENLIAFNHTYLIITRNVVAKLGTNYFYDDAQMQRIDIEFAKYYFAALKEFVDGKKTTPAWQEFFQACEHGHLFQFIYMAMGVNAHVNNDLGFSLVGIATAKWSKADFEKVNAVIQASLPEVVDSLQEKSSMLNCFKRYTRLLYFMPLYWLIRRWRLGAWENFLHLTQKRIKKERIEKKAHTIALYLATIKRSIDIMNLYLIIY